MEPEFLETDSKEIIEDCLKNTAKDGLPRIQMENVENCFW